jgi:hypothetical protein
MSPKDWYAYQRSYPSGVINPDAVIEGMMQAQSLKAASSLHEDRMAVCRPYHIGAGLRMWRSLRTILLVVYLGASTGGIFKSTDNCRPGKASFDDQPILDDRRYCH